MAYVLEDGVDAHGWLDAIFAECFGRDGGRQSLIVPLIDGAISERFKGWLRLLDPDFVVLLTYNNEALLEELAALLSDTTLLEQKRVRDVREQHPRVGINLPSGLTALSWLPFLKTVSGFHQVPPTHILDRYPAWNDDGLVKDNFGTLNGSVNPFPIHQQLGLRGMILTPDNPPENRWHFRSTDGDEVQDPYVVLEKLVERGGIATLGQLSNLRAQPHRPEHSWTDGFCLVVGDTYEDRISCWNAGLLFDDAQSQRYNTLRVPVTALADEAKTAKIAAFLRAGNWIGGNNGPARIFVRSYSLILAELEVFIAQLQEASRSSVVFVAITSMNDCCPSESTRVRSGFNIGNPSAVTAETGITQSTTAVNNPQPMQLAYCAGIHPIFSQGSWYIDLSIDRLNDIGRFSNVREPWVLPIRRQLVRYLTEADGARLRCDGSVSIPVSIDSGPVEVKQPEDAIIFQSLATERAHFHYYDLRGRQVKEAAYRYAEPSDKGSYLQGLIGMFGSLSDIEHTMSTHFWRAKFTDMAAPAQSQHEEVITYIQRRMKARNGKLVIEDDCGWKNLAQRIVQKASKLKVPRLRTRYDSLLAAWTTELTAAIEGDENLKKRRDEILGEREDDLKRSLSYLVDRGIFYRGHEWSCRECRHRNWLGVEALKDVIPCEVCGREHQLPVDVALDFRLNEFFATCLREHDTIAVAWAIGALRQQARRSFMFAPQTALYRDYPEKQGGRADREVDLICVMDGKFVIGEVKANSELIAKSDVEDLAAAAQEVGADIAILAAMVGERATMEAKAQELRALLPITIEAKWLLSDWDDTPSSYL
ncbi:MAG: hypothetical protein NTV11_10085 [Rhodocyclales bacterium]|nr:hypothetical protein [Rhodocyclales bacterium]